MTECKICHKDVPTELLPGHVCTPWIFKVGDN